jgi:hypothetical protein
LFVDVIADMMAKDPAQRISTAMEVVTRLAPWSREFQRQRANAPVSFAAASAPSVEPPPRTVAAANHAAALSATPLAPLGEQPLPPPPPPADPRARSAYADMGVAPPPVIAQPIAEWDWDGPASSESPVLIGESPLRDTLPDLPQGLETSSDSEASISLIVEPPRRMPLWLLMALVLTPVVLAGLVLLVLWLRDAATSGPL